MEKYRIENIQKVRLNNRELKGFDAYKYEKDSNAYVFCGKQYAPVKTANKNLVDRITETNGYCRY